MKFGYDSVFSCENKLPAHGVRTRVLNQERPKMGELIYFQQPKDDTTVFISNLSSRTTESHLQARLAEFGPLYAVKIFTKEKKYPSGNQTTQVTQGGTPNNPRMFWC